MLAAIEPHYPNEERAKPTADWLGTDAADLLRAAVTPTVERRAGDALRHLGRRSRSAGFPLANLVIAKSLPRSARGGEVRHALEKFEKCGSDAEEIRLDLDQIPATF